MTCTLCYSTCLLQLENAISFAKGRSNYLGHAIMVPQTANKYSVGQEWNYKLRHLFLDFLNTLHCFLECLFCLQKKKKTFPKMTVTHLVLHMYQCFNSGSEATCTMEHCPRH